MMTETEYDSEWRKLAVNLIDHLLSKAKELDKRCEVQLMQLSDLQERHHRLTLRVGHLETELYKDEDDTPQQHCVEALETVSTDEEIEEWADAATEVTLEEMDPEVHGWRRCFTAKEFSETIRAALARWGTPANNTRGTH